MRLLFIISIGALALCVAQRSRAEYDPAFDLDTCVGGAQLIVRGSIDGADRLSIEQVFAGDLDGAKVITLGDTDLYYNRARQGKMMERARAYLEWFWRRYLPWLQRREAVVFLERRGFDGKWVTDGGGNTVWLRGTELFPFDGDSYDNPTPRYQRGPFFAALAEAIRTAAERTRLLAQQRSPDRARALVALALAHDRLPPATLDRFLFVPFYHLTTIGKGLRDPSPAEQAIVLSALESAKTDGDRIKLLRLVGLIPLPSNAFAAVSKFTSHAPGAVRKAALESMGTIDLWQAQGVLARFLSMEEPQLHAVLEDLDPMNRWIIDPGVPEPVRNNAMVEPLVRLGRELHAERARRVKEGTSGYDLMWDQRLSTLTGQLEHFQHPQFVCLLMEWALAPDDLSTWPARHALDNITRATITSDNLALWVTWWHSARPLLEASYDLQSDAGRTAWMAAWSQGDKYVRPILMNLWNYEPQIDEGALLALAEQPAAARLLSDLWRWQRLSPAAQKWIVEHFFNPVLVEAAGPFQGQRPCHREVTAEVKSSFPFPETVEVEYGSNIVVNEDVTHVPTVDLDRTHGATSLPSLAESHHEAGAWSGERCGQPVAHGLLQMRALDYAHDRRLLWPVSKELGPLQLRDIPGPPQPESTNWKTPSGWWRYPSN